MTMDHTVWYASDPSLSFTSPYLNSRSKSHSFELNLWKKPPKPKLSTSGYKPFYVRKLTCYQHTRNYQVHKIISGPPPYMDCVRHIWVRLRTAYINNFIPFRWKANQVPFTVCYKLLCVALIWFHFNVKSVTIVRPWTELHRAELKRNQNWDQVNDNRESLQAKRDRGQSGLRIQETCRFSAKVVEFFELKKEKRK